VPNCLGQDPGGILGLPARLAAVTPNALRDVFLRDFPLDRYTVVTLVPGTVPAQ